MSFTALFPCLRHKDLLTFQQLDLNLLRWTSRAVAAQLHSSNSSCFVEQLHLETSSSRGATELMQRGKSWVMHCWMSSRRTPALEFLSSHLRCCGIMFRVELLWTPSGTLSPLPKIREEIGQAVWAWGVYGSPVTMWGSKRVTSTPTRHHSLHFPQVWPTREFWPLLVVSHLGPSCWLHAGKLNFQRAVNVCSSEPGIVPGEFPGGV